MRNLSRLQRLRRAEDILRKRKPMETTAMISESEKFSLAIIGNGPSAKKNKIGDKIDSYDYVLRFNQFDIEGYEEYVGTKTTHLSLNMFCIDRYEVLFKTICKNEKYLRNLNTVLLYAKPKDDAVNILYSFIQLNCFEIITDIYKRDIDLNVMRMHPSMGVRTIHYMLHNPYIKQTIGVAGMDFIDGVHGHYNNIPYEAVHDISSEQKWLNKRLIDNSIALIQ